jgi:hypothetical protein
MTHIIGHLFSSRYYSSLRLFSAANELNRHSVTTVQLTPGIDTRIENLKQLRIIDSGYLSITLLNLPSMLGFWNKKFVRSIC